MSDALIRLLKSKRVIVSCGAGGVGKTTVSASLSAYAARLGLRVLVVTIDPSKRLAEALGVTRNAPEPVAVELDEPCTGSLHAWMLDPQMVSNQVVEKFSRSPEEANRLLNNRIYQNVTAMVAGMQEYTAVEALCGFVSTDRYDLVILDTPPSRDALRFLDAPLRANAFLDRRIFNLFIPSEGGLIRRMATKLVEQVMDVAFGRNTREDLQQFFLLFGSLLGHLNANQSEMQQFFRAETVGFLMVTSPSELALKETRFFRSKTEELGLRVCGVVLNRSLAMEADLNRPDISDVEGELTPAHRSLFNRFVGEAELELETAKEHAALGRSIAQSNAEPVWVFPFVQTQAIDVAHLEALARRAVCLDKGEVT
ncbi:MAG: ArsA family ATPase [Bradymonadia bacterium]